MAEKIDIVEILKDKPANTKLYSPLFGEVDFSHVGGDNIAVEHHGGISLFFSSGRFFDLDESEPLLFPSKEMRNWSKFAWKKGDVLYSAGLKEYCVFNKFISDGYLMFISKYNVDENTKRVVPKTYDPDKNTVNYEKVSDEKATEIISLIEEHYGGKLNLSTLEIEKQSEFKDGDIVALVVRKCTHIAIFQSRQEAYIGFHAVLCQNDELLLEEPFREDVGDIELRLATDSEKQQLFDALEKEGKAWDAEKKQIVDLKPKCEFKPFDKVLSRRCSEDYWVLNFYSHKIDYYHICIDGSSNLYCIPYNEETAHLLGTTDEWKGGEQ
jgi:hypothetical protein